MGLFNKLKNALFEDEELVVEDLPEIKKEEEKPVVEPKKEEKKSKNVLLEDEENERDLFKAENTFKFPEFDEEEFQTNYKTLLEKEEEEKKEEVKLTPKESFDRVKPITYEYEKPVTLRKEPKKESPKTEEKKTFKPSPVISPVYGILDKNYKKEDLIVKEEAPKPKKKIDVDAIRKKAFGTLEDDIESTFEQPKKEFYEENKRKEDLLEKTIEEKIEIDDTTPTTREARNEKRRDHSVIVDYEEEEKPNYEEYEETKELKTIDPEKKPDYEEATLENDLFDLIDSMYDNREDDE